jgi:hypothetical protein
MIEAWDMAWVRLSYFERYQLVTVLFAEALPGDTVYACRCPDVGYYNWHRIDQDGD